MPHHSDGRARRSGGLPRPGGEGTRRWLTTAVATLVSTYALDAAATAAGVVTVTSGVLGGVDGPLLVAALLVSYVGWGFGLRRGLRANLALLGARGVSTNVVSKAAYDLVRRRCRSPRAVRIAAGCGYVVVEMAKEIPYYAGAFGAAAATDTVSRKEAVVFLVGANLGAGAYEYGLAGAIRLLLRSRYADFDTEWDPAAYLADYYRSVEPDEEATIAFLVDELRAAPCADRALVYGVGPTMHHVFALAAVARRIDLGEYLGANRAAVTSWLAGAQEAHDWRAFVRHTLRCEGVADPSSEEVAAREALTRRRVARVLPVDARQPPAQPERYPLVISCYCADSATDDAAEWERFMAAIMAHVEPGGLLLLAALRRCRGYAVGGRRFPGANVDESDVLRVLEDGWGRGGTTVVGRALPDQPDHGYAGIVLASAVRPLRGADGG